MKFLIRLVFIAVIAIAIALVGLLMLPGEKIAKIAADQLSKQTGRTVEISSDTSISFYPILGISTKEATIGSAEWAKNGPLFHTDNLAIGVDVAALLTGTVKITKLEAASPKVILEKTTDGRVNWDMFGAANADNTAPANAPEAAPSAASSSAESNQDSYEISLERAIIKNAAVRYIDHGAGTDQMFENIDLDLRWPDQNGPAQVELGVKPFSERVAITASIGNVLGLAAGQNAPVEGTISTAQNTVDFKGIASSAPNMAMQVKANLPKIAQVLAAAGQTPEQLGLPKGFDAAAHLAADVTFDGSRLTLRKMDAALDDSSVKGDIDLVLTDTSPDVTAQVTATIVKAGDLMRLLGQAPETFGLGKSFNPDVATKLGLALSGTDVSATLDDLDASIAKGRFTGNADVVLKNGTPNITANMAVNIPDAAALAAQLGQPLQAFGLSKSAKPSLKSQVTASVKGSTVTASLKDMSAGLAGATASGALNIAVTGQGPDVSGQIKAKVPNTSALMSALGQAPVDLPKGFGRAVSADTKLSFKDNLLKLSNMAVSLDQNTLRGSAAVSLKSSVPHVTADLSAGALDLSALSSDSASSESAPSSGWSKDRIDASALGLINGTIALKAASIDLGMTQLGQTDVKTTIDRSRAVFKINALRAFDGYFSGQAVANNRNGLSVSTDLEIKSLSLKRMLTEMAGIDAIDAKTRITVSLLGAGNSVNAIMKSLSGNLYLRIPEGTVAGVDLEGLIKSGNANASLTRFSNLRAKAAIKGGVARNSDLTVTTGRVDAKGEGYVNLGAQTLDYLFTPILKDAHSSDTLAVPVRIKGPWSGPKIRPDLEAALNLKAERKKLEKQARDEIEREKKKLREKAEAKVRKKLDAEAKKAAAKAAKKLGLDENEKNSLEDAVKGGLENELRNGLRGLLGNN